jgi:hypothetical protein
VVEIWVGMSMVWDGWCIHRVGLGGKTWFCILAGILRYFALDCMGFVSDEDIENINLNVESQKFRNKIFFVLFHVNTGLMTRFSWDS